MGPEVGATFCLGCHEALIGWWWVWEALANLVHDVIVTAAAGRGVLAGGMCIKRGYFQSGRSVQRSLAVSHSPYNYGHWLTLLPSFIPTACGTAPLQLCNTVGLGHTATISGQTWIRKRYFSFVNVIKCFVKYNVSIKCNVGVK